MLTCRVDLSQLDDDSLQCGECRKCKGESKLDYPFEKDLHTSKDLVNELIKYVKENTPYLAKETLINKNPDINIYKDESHQELLCRIEAKFLEGQGFMTAKATIGLHPKETLVVDEPKLQSYFACKENDRKAGKNIPIYVVWKFDRPCDDVGGIAVFQEIDILHQIYQECGDTRKLRRATGKNDFQNGVQMGITEKYHFSIKECEPIERLIPTIMKE